MKWFAGLKQKHLQCCFKVEAGVATEVYASGQLSWSFFDIAKNFSSLVSIGNEITELLAEWNSQVKSIGNSSSIGKLDEIIQLNVPPGHVYFRMARSIFQYPHEKPYVYQNSPAGETELAKARSELSSFLLRLKAICRVVEPDKNGLEAYGIEIGELLVVTCVALENNLRRILMKNGVAKDRYSTKDFVKLLHPMMLDKYEFDFLDFPWLSTFAPYSSWDFNNPTTSLEWYDRYNKEKHDRDNLSKKPRLLDCFDAIGAFAGIVAGQFGVPQALHKNSIIQESLSLVSFPTWDLSDLYIHLNDSGAVKPFDKIKYPFL